MSEGANILFDADKVHEHRWGLTNAGTGSIALGAFKMPPIPNLPADIKAALASPDLVKDVPKGDISAFLDAWDPVAAKRIWRVHLANLFDRSGVLATGGGIVVQGNIEGELKVYDALDGTLLKTLDTGSSIIAAPMTYLVGDEQYIAVMAGIGGGPLAFAPPPGSAADKYGNQGRILAFKLNGSPTPKPEALPPPPPFPQPPLSDASQASIDHGHDLFSQTCGRCHLNASPHGASPDLRRMTAATHAAFAQIVLKGALRPLGMPQWDDVLSVEDVNDIHAYLISIARAAYDQQQASTH